MSAQLPAGQPDGWQTTEPPKDGTEIIAIGRVIWREDDQVSVRPFCAAVCYYKDAFGYEGWHHSDSTLVVATELEDEVKIDFWNFPPHSKYGYQQNCNCVLCRVQREVLR